MSRWNLRNDGQTPDRSCCSSCIQYKTLPFRGQTRFCQIANLNVTVTSPICDEYRIGDQFWCFRGTTKLSTQACIKWQREKKKGCRGCDYGKLIKDLCRLAKIKAKSEMVAEKPKRKLLRRKAV